MAKFRAHIIDPLRGEERVELVKAGSADKARSVLEKKGLTVLEIGPVVEVAGSRGKGSGGGLVRAVVNLLMMGAVGWALYTLSPRLRGGWLASWASSSGPTMVRVAIKGELVNALGGSPDPELVKVTLRLPRADFAQSWAGSEILDGGGKLSQRVEFQSPGYPGDAEVLVEVTGFQTVEETDLALSGPDSTLDLGEIVLRHQRD